MRVLENFFQLLAQFVDRLRRLRLLIFLVGFIRRLIRRHAEGSEHRKQYHWNHPFHDLDSP